MKKFTELEVKRLEEFNSRLNSLQFDIYKFASYLENKGKKYAADKINNSAFSLDEAYRIIEYLKEINSAKTK